MVAKIITGKSMRGALLYNERKVEKGQAELLLAAGFGMDVSRLSFYDKLDRFTALTSLRESIKTNTLHISLNFPPEENPDEEKTRQIALRYMELIGFGEQPFLVYRHHDAGHDHVHIVTTQIKPDGVPIALNGIGRLVSEPARKQVEEEFGLLRADRRKRPDGPTIPAADLQAIAYGKTDTKRAINNVVLAVTREYLYTSIPELNAVLEQFNVTCDQGERGSLQLEHGGLTYSLLDKEGHKIGVPIKASLFYCKPTLKNLGKRFEQNREKRKQHRVSLAGKIERVLDKYERLSLKTFLSELARLGVSARFVRNEDGRYYGVTFTEHSTKAVFKGSDLGKAFTAEALTTNFASTDKHKAYLENSASPILQVPHAANEHSSTTPGEYPGLLDQLLEKTPIDYGPTTLPKRKRRRRRQGLSR